MSPLVSSHKLTVSWNACSLRSRTQRECTPSPGTRPPSAALRCQSHAVPSSTLNLLGLQQDLICNAALPLEHSRYSTSAWEQINRDQTRAWEGNGCRWGRTRVWGAQAEASALHLRDHSKSLVGSEPQGGMSGSVVQSSTRLSLRLASTGPKSLAGRLLSSLGIQALGDLAQAPGH